MSANDTEVKSLNYSASGMTRPKVRLPYRRGKSLNAVNVVVIIGLLFLTCLVGLWFIMLQSVIFGATKSADARSILGRLRFIVVLPRKSQEDIHGGAVLGWTKHRLKSIHERKQSTVGLNELNNAGGNTADVDGDIYQRVQLQLKKAKDEETRRQMEHVGGAASRSEMKETKELIDVAPPMPPKIAIDGCTFSAPMEGELPGCALFKPGTMECQVFTTISDAIDACIENEEQCGGITRTGFIAFELRGSLETLPKEKYYSYSMNCERGDERKPPLPPFYEYPSDKDIDEMGTYVNGQPTIFIKISSYRDDMCPESITNALEVALYPERLFFGITEQNAPGDLGCLDPPRSCANDPNQAICKAIANKQISIYKMPASLATGPVFARHVGDRMFRGEYFVLQIDAHIKFVKHWDEKMINQWKLTKNDRAVLSTYPTDTTNFEGHPSINEFGESTVNTSPIMCDYNFEFNHLVRHLAAHEVSFPKRKIGLTPMLHPFWAAGLSFARGHFHGEEIAIAVRGWTYGYDYYSPVEAVLFHPYHRPKKPPMFWENANKHKGAGMKAAQRILAEFGEDHDKDIDTTDIEMYNLGTERKESDFNYVFGIDWKNEKINRDLCEWAPNGIMHMELVKYLKPNGRGIDYSKVLDESNHVKLAPKMQRATPT